MCCGCCETLVAAAAANNHFFTLLLAPQRSRLSSTQMGDNPLPNPRGSCERREALSECECLLLHALSAHTHMCAASESDRRCQGASDTFYFPPQLAFLFSRWDFTSTAFMALGNSLMWLYGVKKYAHARILRLGASRIHTLQWPI